MSSLTSFDMPATLEAACAPMVIFDATGKLVWSNAAYRDAFDGGSRPGFIEWANRHRPITLISMLDALANGKSWKDELEEKHRTERRFIIASITPLHGKDNHYFAILADVTRYKRDTADALYCATRDKLTGVANRQSFDDMLEHWIRMTRRDETVSALLLLDLDGFKQVNDTFGHPVGDIVLQETAARIVGSIREADFVARFGGDEFAVMLGRLQDEADAGVIAQKIVDSFVDPFTWNSSSSARVGVSVGVCVFGAKVGDSEQPLLDQKHIFQEADKWLYEAKKAGKRCWHASFRNPDEVLQKEPVVINIS